MNNPLAGADLYDWIALRRVSEGGVAQVGDRWLENGHRVPGYVTDALTELLAGGLVALADQDPYSLQRATLTDTGTARYDWLCRLQLVAPQVPAPRFGSACQRAGVNDADPPGGTALPD